jgi:hypothetical protein
LRQLYSMWSIVFVSHDPTFATDVEPRITFDASSI